ncbi:MAG TPA: hypothetical protein VIJ51_15665 [Solirubrobacteraceae bacterium]
MGMLAWVMMGLAIWHYTIFLPDRFWGGIVGAFVGAILGSIIVGMVIYAAKSGAIKIPGRDDTHLVTALYAVPGALGGLAAVYFEGIRRESVVED